MADFQGWQRQILPQGKLVAPETGPSLADSFGQGIAALANTAAATVESVRKTDEWRDEKQWQIDQPKAAALVNSLQRQHAEQMPDIEAKSAPGLADYPDKINEAITRLTEEGLKGNPDPRFQRYVRGYMDDLRTSSVIAGIQKRTAATLAKDATALQQLVDDQSADVIKDFSNFDAAARLVGETISNNPLLTADQKSTVIRSNKRALAMIGLDSLVERDAAAARQIIASGELDDILTTADKEAFLSDIKSEQERKATEARIANENRIQAVRTEVDANLPLITKQALETGQFDTTIRTKIIAAYGEVTGKEIIADLDNARYIGQDALAIANQSPRADTQLLRKLSDVASQNQDDRRAQVRLQFAQQHIYEKRSGLKYAPEEYVRQHSAAVQENWDAFAKNPYDATTTRIAIETPIQAQRKLGVAEDRLDPVSQAAADLVAERVKRDGPAAIATMQQNFGDHFSHVIGKLVYRGPFFTAALMLDRPGQAGTQAALLELDSDPRSVPKLEKILAVDIGLKDRLEKLVNRNLDDLRQSYATQPGGETAFYNLSASTYALALRHMKTDKMSAREAAKTAAGEIGVNYYEFGHLNGSLCRIPKGKSAPEVMLGAQNYAKNLINLPLDPPEDAEDMSRREIADSLASQGYWVNLPDDSGLMLVFATGQAATAGGKPITRTWFQLFQAADAPQQ